MKTAPYLTILLAIPLVLDAQSETGKLMLRVTDDAGGSMSAAHVVIHPNDSKSPDMLLSSGSPFGEFSATLAPGVYDVFVSSRCFVPIAKEFKVVPDRQQSVTVKLYMQVSQDSIAEGCPWPEDCCSQPALVDTIPSTIPDQIPAKK